MARPWKECSMCRTNIPVGGDYYTCSVSTCNRARDTKVFCSVACWDAHVPVMGHRSAWANEQRAPSSLASAEAGRSPSEAGPDRTPRSSSASTSNAEVLVIASRLKEFIRASSGMNTSADVLTVLSDHIRVLSYEAIERAREDGRKTVKARDFRSPVG